MKKNISKSQIVETALELMRSKSDLSGINLREIAREIGCAHTNLYNYFSSYSELLWETHASLMEIFVDIMRDRLKIANGSEQEFITFFKTFSDIYLDNKGWFKLAWHEYIGDVRSQRDVQATQKASDELQEMIWHIWRGISGQYPDKAQTGQVLHSTHCYIVGEVSNHLLGRGMIENEEKLKIHISNEAIKMFSLCLLEE